MAVRKINPQVFHVGVIDWDRILFDELVPLPEGTSYNSYLIQGSEKTAIIDTAYSPKKNEFLENIKNSKIDKIDYIISNHAEGDHSDSIPALLEMYPDAKIVTNAKCKALLVDYLNISEEKFLIIQDRETLSLGDKTLEFIIAPWVHWPDTMFTYLREDKILFSCDFMGSHLATSDLYVTEESRVYDAAKRYYAEIMMPFRTHIKKHLEKLKELKIDIIAPSHGPVYKNPEFIINAYTQWASDEVKKEVIIPYVSMYQSTEKMVNYLVDRLIEKGLYVRPYNMINNDVGEFTKALVNASTLVIATPMVLAGAHPSIVYAASLANALRPKTKFISMICSYGWGGNAIDQIKSLLSGLKTELIEPVIVKGHPKETDFELLDKLAEEIFIKNNS